MNRRIVLFLVIDPLFEKTLELLQLETKQLCEITGAGWNHGSLGRHNRSCRCCLKIRNHRVKLAFLLLTWLLLLSNA